MLSLLQQRVATILAALSEAENFALAGGAGTATAYGSCSGTRGWVREFDNAARLPRWCARYSP